MVEPTHLRLEHDDSLISVRGYRLTKLVDILLYAWRGDRHCYVDLVGVFAARMGRRNACSTLLFIEKGKSDKYARSCISYGFDFSPFGFLFIGSFFPAPEDLLYRFCRKYVSHAHIPKWEAYP